MRAGDVLGHRFEILRFAGSGGMGEVFHALDRLTGEPVAVKVRVADTPQQKARFDREIQVLMELRHPAIVRYVAHGATSSGETYLAMEWLAGEDLQVRLRRERITVGESVRLVARTAEALGHAHARGVIHRDIKPSNLFLVNADPAHVKVLDFGLARLDRFARMTQKGAMLGTPSYMAPEQARADDVLTPQADVFALGCVLFECLTGLVAFQADHAMAVLAKILFEETPRVVHLCPDLPADLDALIARMLAKDPRDRPRDGGAVAAEIDALGAIVVQARAVPSLRPVATDSVSLTTDERRLLSVVLIAAPSGAERRAAAAPSPAGAGLMAAAEAAGGHIEMLLDGTTVVTVSGTGIATDQAVRAARCALSLRAPAGRRPIALAMGRGALTGKLPLSDAIDRAARMLVEQAGTWTGSHESPETRPVAIDDVTAGLLDARFDIREADRGLHLYGEHDHADMTRTLLGKPVPCVGRDRELTTLQGIFAECVEEPRAQAAMVTAAAGIGKSRLAHEFLRILKRGGEPVEIWIGRGEAMRTGSAFGLLGQAIRGACGIRDGESSAERRKKLCERIERHVAPEHRRRVSEFFGELAGIPFADDDSALLRAARRDAQVMGEQITGAWQDFVRAECDARPVLLLLEDLHWSDRPTVRLIDVTLRDLKTRPFMVLALARPEVHETFPKLWIDRGVHEIRLPELTRKASERLVRMVLGDRADREMLTRLVSQAAGHAFYLEELIRAVMEAKGAALPATVVAMVQARLEGLEGEARRVLRAASVFGEVFWQGGVVALLGGNPRTTLTTDWLDALAEREVLERRPESRFAGEEEFTFRHALLRAGAYAMLTEDDRTLGHRLAAEWLEQRGESDPVVLAEHFELGGQPVRAGSYHLRAAELANRAGDSITALSHARRGLACELPEPMRIELLSVLATTHGWRGEDDLAAEHFDELVRLAPPGSMPWARGMAYKQGIALGKRNIFEFMSILQTLQTVVPVPEAVHLIAGALVYGIFLLTSMGRAELSQPLVERIQAIVMPVADRDPVARGWMQMSATRVEAWVDEHPSASLDRAEAAIASFSEAGYNRGILVARVITGMNRWLLGALEQADQDLRQTVGVADLGPLASLRTLLLGLVLLDLGKRDEARSLAGGLIDDDGPARAAVDEGRGRWMLAEVCLRQGDLQTAERELQAALNLLQLIPVERIPATATLAAIQLAQGRAVEALSTAQATMQGYETLRIFGFRGAFASLVHAQALHATGARDEAREALSRARDRLLANAARIADPALRQSFLARVPANARTLELAGEWQCPPPPE